MTVDSYHQITSIASKYDGNNIYLIGKGKSIDEINFVDLEPGLIININDSERVVKGDICIFHGDWVIDSLSRYGFGCSLYVTDKSLPNEVTGMVVDHAARDKDGFDFIFQRFASSEIVIEDILFVTALKVSKVIADIKMRRLNVFFLGFDFDTKMGYSASIVEDYSGDDEGYKSSYINAQEHIFLLLMNQLRESNLLIRHIGDRIFSHYSCAEFNKIYSIPESEKKKKKQFDSKDLESAAGQVTKCSEKIKFDDASTDSVSIVAEFTTNHFGDLERLSKMIKRSAESGADIIKVQKRNIETFYSKEQLNSTYSSIYGEKFGDYRKGIELDENGFELIANECEKHGIKWSVSVLDYQSYQFVMKFKPSMIKLPSTISQHRAFIEKIASEYIGDIVVSTGFTDSDYERYILNLFSKNSKIYLLQCVSAYPTKLIDCSIGVVRHYYNMSKVYRNLIPGYSSHDIGSLASSLAVAAGAKMIEKHVKYDTVEGGHFDEVAVSLIGDDFSKIVNDIRLAQKICGKEQKNVKECEHHKYWV